VVCKEVHPLRRQRKKTLTGGLVRKSRSAEHKKTTTKKTTKKKKSRVLKRLFTFCLFLIFVGMIVVTGIGAGMYAAVAKEMEDMDIRNLELKYSSFLYYTDATGSAHELERIFDDSNRIWVESEKIPQVMKDALVSIEDERFYTHAGVDLKRTAGAFFGWVREKIGGGEASYGGSTITQQVIKNITNEKKRSPARKVKEMMRAIALEREMTKDEILTVYLNLVYFANNCYGIETASHVYFDKPCSELKLTEAAMIAGITQRPSYYDPLRNPENALQKRNTVLAKMYELEKISKEEYDAAIQTDLGLNSTYQQVRSRLYSYYVDQVINDVISDLQTKKGYSESFATQQVFNGGLRIYTAMDYEIQNAMEEIFENKKNFPATKAQAQAAMVIVEPSTGAIKGMVGGLGEKTESRGFNRATQMKRQPGSSLKPLAVYVPALETGKITPATILEDAKLTVGDWSPKNSYSGYKGNMIVRRAVEISANTPAVRVMQEVGPSTAYGFLKDKFHFTTLDPADVALSPMSLGGLTYGVTVKEMAAAYGVLANGGKYTKPYTYTKVTDNNGKVLLENQTEESTSISKGVSYVMTQLLSSVVKGGSGTGKLAKLSRMPAYGKTGTTNNDHDKWFVGYTPYYTGAVWYGFDTQSSIRRAGVTYNVSAKIWKMVMEKVHENLPVKDFEMPGDVEQATICSKTGRLAAAGCAYRTREYLLKGTAPKRSCAGAHAPETTPTPEPLAEATTEPAQESKEPVVEIPSQETQAPTPEEKPVEISDVVELD